MPCSFTLLRSAHDLVGAAVKERGDLCAAPNADDKAEPSRTSRNDADSRILEDYGVRRRSIETSRGFQEHIGIRLAPQA